MNNSINIIHNRNILILELKLLRIFVQVVKSGSFSAAAEQLCYTQPTISKSIQQLEQQIGEKLFITGYRKRHVKLTFIGEHVYKHALSILQQHEDMLDSIQNIRSLKAGELSLGLPPLGAILMHRLIARYHRNYPEIKLNFLEVGSLKIEEALVNKKIDVGIVLGNPHSDLYSIKILNSPLCLLAKQDSHLTKYEKINFDDLKNENFIFYTDDFSLTPIILSEAQKAGFEPNIVCKSSQWDFIVKMVEANMGIAILPEIYCRKFSNLKKIYFNSDDMTWQLHMAWHKGLETSHATKAWLNLVNKYSHEISL